MPAGGLAEAVQRIEALEATYVAIATRVDTLEVAASAAAAAALAAAQAATLAATAADNLASHVARLQHVLSQTGIPLREVWS